jgi:pyruvate/2-oxoglutarate/acetoin dehydrogenase E1 component
MSDVLTYSEAIRDALAEEMRRDERVFLMGEDIALYGGAFRVTRGLLDEFGPARVRNTPISEGGIVGAGIGAALVGCRPVVEIMFMDFITLAVDQLVNHAAKYRFMYGEQARVPLVVRTPAGGHRGYGPTHSQCLERLFFCMPGIKIAAPATPADAKGLLKAAIRDDNPVLFVENKTLYAVRADVPSGEEALVPLGKAAIARRGEHVTVVTYSEMVVQALKAADALEAEGIRVEVIDLRTLVPMDMETVLESVERTGRAVVAEEGHLTGGIGAEVACRIVEKLFYQLEAPVRRVAGMDVPVPVSQPLERAALPSATHIAQAVREVVGC